jgi:hypothetical protein
MGAKWGQPRFAAPFEAFRWETPGITAGDLQTAFGFVVKDSPQRQVSGRSTTR